VQSIAAKNLRCPDSRIIGRDLDCHFVVDAVHTWVSRKHLVILSIDASTDRVQIQDLSRQHLTKCSTNIDANLRDGAWFPIGSRFTLGATDTYAGFVFQVDSQPPSRISRPSLVLELP
jgi:hypothetical protein